MTPDEYNAHARELHDKLYGTPKSNVVQFPVRVPPPKPAEPEEPKPPSDTDRLRADGYLALLAEREAMCLALDEAREFQAQTCRQIIRDVCAEFDIRFIDIISDRRDNAVMLPRRWAMYRCRSETTASYSHIGRIFNRDHSTVMHAVRMMEAQIAAHKPPVAFG